MNNEKIHIKLYSSGYCTASTKYIFPDQPAERIAFHATWALIDHPVLGKILFDTGYSYRFYESTRSLPNRIYRWITPVFHKKEEACLNKLLELKINPEEIRNIVISHFHADHIGGLRDFPGAKIWCSEIALEFALKINRFSAVFKGILKSQIPDDICRITSFPEEEFPESSISGLTAWRWQDDIYFIDLPGHARGQMGLYLKDTSYGDLLLCADAAWSVKAIHEKIYPSRMVSLISDNYSELTRTIDKLYNFHINNPQIKIVPAHCHETLQINRN
ncbi:MAG: MBL fold metallo-hydrolase [Bacteroidales bacterium]|nr:MBL fold metallo-hydrolase [Bacteroidales bacterium]